ncbi:hypothetical protein AXG93_2016s1370 [Marchantia polymorpha subsp. ruderalis]|uniref:Cytochrome b5 heme-binding domain-containing protein n=1 Tax=Marchantia polymorpha subsp. ruderalis TaxID=1480154 RepID=A0A176VWS6_MARPO|nr:hypothetical protein AXG93_2016s1370 [Marchantia polymorpha subsp. ruderalis]
MATAAKDRLVTKIHDKWYDLTDFEKIHPGGPVALGLASGRDGTVMFESHHPFTHRKILDAILQKYELDEESSRHLKTLEEQHGIAEHRFNWKSEFGDALKFHVKEYFEAEAKRRNVSLVAATKAPPERWFEIAVLGVIFFATLVSFIRGDWISLFTCPLGVWVFGVNTFHDAAHFALHKNWRVNCTVPYLFPHFSSPFVWYHQHNIGHHSYPNVAHRDPDLVHHYWMKREHKSVKWLPAHEKQRNLSFLVFWWTVAVEFGLATMEDLWMVMYNVYNESVPMKINHLTPETAHEADQDWYKHQVITAQDFGVASRFCFLMSGGLNYQVVHHLFPTVNHCHLVKLQPIVARLCEKHGVEYKQVAGYAAAIKAHHAHTVNMSFKDNEN